jgi:ATP-binding cassette subfamily B protein
MGPSCGKLWYDKIINIYASICLMALLRPFFIAVTRSYRKHIGGLLGVALGRALIINLQAYIVKRLIDTVSGGAVVANHRLVASLFLGFLALSLGFVLLFRFYDAIIAQFVPRLKKTVSLYIVHRILRQPPEFYQLHFAGQLTNRVNDISYQTPEVIRIVTDHFMTSILTLILVLVNMSMVSPRFAYLLLGWLVVFMTGSLWILSRNSTLTKKAAEARTHMIGRLVDMLVNIASIRLFGRANHEESLFHLHAKESAAREKKRDLFFMRLHGFQGLSFWLFEIGSCWWLYQGLMAGHITAGGFILIFTLNLQVLDQFWNVSKDVRKFWDSIGLIKQALTIFQHNVPLENDQEGSTLKVSQGSITFDHVCFGYPNQEFLFNNKTLVIPGGQKVGLVGHSGSGKSTFINLILRLYDIQSGDILIDNQSIRNISKRSLYETISIIPQECYLFNRSIMENIRYGRLEASDAEVYEAARKAHIHDVIQDLPQGYDTMAGEKGMRLSGGQRQRVAIARAFLKNSPIVLLDEATSHLDAVTESLVQEALNELFQGKTVLIVAHRLSTLQEVDRLCVFDRGSIVQDGDHDTLIQQTGLYQRLWNAQMKKAHASDHLSLHIP